MPARSLTRGELLSAGSAAVLTVLLFAVAWYGVDTGRGATSSETGWQGLTDVRWLILLTTLVAFATVVLHAADLTRRAVAGVRLGLLALGTVTAAGLVIRVLIALPSPDRVVDQKLGAVLGMIASLVLAYGAWEAVREQRARLAAGAARSPEVTAEENSS